MKKALYKDAAMEIKNTYKRFLSIMLIVLLGVGFFVGIKAASPDMKITLDKYFDDQNGMDIQVISTLGLTNSDKEALENIEGVEKVETSYQLDAILNSGDEEVVVKLETMPTDINKLVIEEGRLPENNNECVVETRFLDLTGHKIGDTVEVITDKIQDDDGNEKDALKENKLTIVGTVSSPLYISEERGSTKLGSGVIDYYMYIANGNINSEIYTNAYITVDGAKELRSYEDEYDESIEKVKTEIENIAEDRKEERYNEIYDKANSKIEDAQKELDDEKEKAEKELDDAEKKLEDAKDELEAGERELNNNWAAADNEFADAREQLEEAKQELKSQEEEFNSAKQEALDQIEEYNDDLEQLKNVQTQYNTAKSNLNAKQNEVKELNEELATLDPITDAERIQEIQENIESLSKEIYVLNMTISSIENELKNQGISDLDNTIKLLQNAITNAKDELAKNEKLIENAKDELEKQEDKLESTITETYNQLYLAQEEIEDGKKEVSENEKKLEDSRKEFNEEIEKAEDKLNDAKKELLEIEKPEWYILDRDQNVGYASYIQDTDRVAKLASVFPVVFFVVAALISLTTMSRMVEEERGEIGTLKALGYTKVQIAGKYLVYATLATAIGAIIGMLIGFNILPKIIADMYGMMYNLPPVIVEFNVRYALIGLLAAAACTLGATIYSCVKELAQTPATLMRPKAPKPGKRVLLERINFIWSRLNFTHKVTARNLFRYKKRFLMTIIGVMGCTSLIIAGFGLRDAIGYMVPAQYGEIFKYDLNISLKDSEKSEELLESIEQNEKITDALELNMQSVEIVKDDNNQSIQLIVPKDVNELEKYITLKPRKDDEEKYLLNDAGIILTEKLAKLLDINEGNTIRLRNADDIEVDAKVDKITENYIMHYIYMSPTLYEKLYCEEPEYNTIYANTAELNEDQENNLGKEILDSEENVSTIGFTSDTKDIFNDVMENMNFVVWILIVAAGLLAIVVLYNLSNTNISERIRELATIKVLGFYNKEVYDYVSRETIILTIIGILLGLLGGYVLTSYIIKTCELDILMFNPQVHVLSYIYGIVLTAVFAAIINVTTYFALKNIDMIESLKSVE